MQRWKYGSGGSLSLSAMLATIAAVLPADGSSLEINERWGAVQDAEDAQFQLGKGPAVRENGSAMSSVTTDNSLDPGDEVAWQEKQSDERKLRGIAHLDARPLGVIWIRPHKTASSFLNVFFHAVAKKSGKCHLSDMNCLELNEQPLCNHFKTNRALVVRTNDGYPDCVGLYAQSFRGPPKGISYIYSPFRMWEMAPAIRDHGRTLVKVWHHRHPFDVGCSAFFSFGWKHQKPPGVSPEDWQREQQAIRDTGVDKYVETNINRTVKYIRTACDALAKNSPTGSPTAYLSSYEQMVTDFHSWVLRVSDISRIPFSKNNPHIVDHFFDAFQGAFRNNGQHKVSMMPGRYRKDLKPTTITKLRPVVRAAFRDSNTRCLCGSLPDRMGYGDFC